MPKPLTYNATLTERLDLTPKLAIFKVRPDDGIGDGDASPFLPGQYVTLGLNNEERPELGSVRRPMSIVSAPEEREAYEFYIRYVDHPESNNPLTNLLWEVPEGARTYLRNKPVGRFTLPHTVGAGDRRFKLFVAAGTGLAPFVSMVRSRHLQDRHADLSHFAILHGASYPADLAYRDELTRLAEEHGLHYRVSISRPKEAPEWSGDTGRVEDYFLPERIGELERRLGLGADGLRPEKAVVYICGLQGTIGNTIIRLLSRGFVPDNRKLRRALEIPEEVPASLFFEQYDTTPVIDVDNPLVIEPLREEVRGALAIS